MSADNGIYIARFPTELGCEYRVAHLQAIDNCDDSDCYPRELTDHNRNVMWKDAPIFLSEEEAGKKAIQIEESMQDDAFGGYLEYGTCWIEFDRALPSCSIEESGAWLDEYWRVKNEENQKLWNARCAKSEVEAKWLLEKLHVYIAKFAGDFVEFEEIERLANISTTDIQFALQTVQRGLMDRVDEARKLIDGGLTKESLEEDRKAKAKAWLESLDAETCRAWVKAQEKGE